MADENPQTIEPGRTRQPWDRRPDESKRAFDAFVLYRDSADRKLAGVAKALVPPCSTANIGRWVSRHQWQARAADWDCHVDEEQRAELSRGRVARRRKQLQFASALQSIAASALRELQVKVAAQLPLDMAAEQITGLLKLADQLETSAFGPERENCWTKIVVTIGEYPTEKAYEDELRNRADLPGEPA
jgi:hypothetical protein